MGVAGILHLRPAPAQQQEWWNDEKISRGAHSRRLPERTCVFSSSSRCVASWLSISMSTGTACAHTKRAESLSEQSDGAQAYRFGCDDSFLLCSSRHVEKRGRGGHQLASGAGLDDGQQRLIHALAQLLS
jgi:hypothetical protein